MDYRLLLKAYMRHIIDNEDISYLDEFSPSLPGPFTSDEMTALMQIEHELQHEDKEANDVARGLGRS